MEKLRDEKLICLVEKKSEGIENIVFIKLLALLHNIRNYFCRNDRPSSIYLVGDLV